MAIFTDGKQYARHEGDAIEAVCTDGQLLTGIASTSSWALRPRMRHGMHVNAVDDLTTREPPSGFGIVGTSPQTGRITGIGDGMSRVDGSTGRGINLVRMMQFDDFGGGFEEAGAATLAKSSRPALRKWRNSVR